MVKTVSRIRIHSKICLTDICNMPVPNPGIIVTKHKDVLNMAPLLHSVVYVSVGKIRK